MMDETKRCARRGYARHYNYIRPEVIGRFRGRVLHPLVGNADIYIQGASLPIFCSSARFARPGRRAEGMAVRRSALMWQFVVF